MKQPGDLVIVLRPLPSDVPLGVRLKGVLKYALRAADLKCVEAVEVPAGKGVELAADGQEETKAGTG